MSDKEQFQQDYTNLQLQFYGKQQERVGLIILTDDEFDMITGGRMSPLNVAKSLCDRSIPSYIFKKS